MILISGYPRPCPRHVLGLQMCPGFSMSPLPPLSKSCMLRLCSFLRLSALLFSFLSLQHHCPAPHSGAMSLSPGHRPPRCFLQTKPFVIAAHKCPQTQLRSHVSHSVTSCLSDCGTLKEGLCDRSMATTTRARHWSTPSM